MKALLRHVFYWANKNEMSFGINKFIKPLYFVSYPDYEKPTFHLSIYSIPKESMYIYLGIPFSNGLSLEPIITYINTKIKKP